MSGYRKWRDTDHLERAIRTAGGPEIFDDEVRRDVSTRDVLDRYVAALGGTLNLVADFGDEQLKVG